MDKKNIGAIAIIAAVLIGAAVFALKNSDKPTEAQNVTAADAQGDGKESADKVQIYMFHATQRCSTCIAIGRLAGETVNEYFQPELESGRIEFREINIDLPENKMLAKKFQASGAALYINSIVDGEDDIVQDTKVWRLADDEAEFKIHLRDEINNRLKV